MAQHLWLRLLAAIALLSLLTAPATGVAGSYVPDVDYLKTPAGQTLTAEQALNSDQWQRLEDNSPNFGYIRDTVWLRISAGAPGSIDLLEVQYPQLDHLEFFLFRNGQQIQHRVTGDQVPFSQRPISDRHFLFPVEQEPGADYDILLKVDTQGAMQVPVELWNSREFYETSSVEAQIHAVYYGILITVIFFNLFIFSVLREPVYLVYVLSTLCYLLLVASLNGTTFQMLWPAYPAVQNQAMLLVVPMAVVCTLQFSRLFLKLKQTAPAWDRLVRFAIWMNLLVAAYTFMTDYSVGSRLTVALAIPSCLLLTILGPYQWYRGNPQAVFYTIAWGALTLGSAATGANKYGLLPNNFLTAYSMQIGSALEAILLTLALAARLYQERQDKIVAREAELKAMAARRAAELRLMDHALHNPVTGFPNRSSFEMTLNDLMTRAAEHRYGVVVIRLNNLDSVTKTLGHRNSDRILELASKHYNAAIKDLPGALPVEQTEAQTYFLAALDSQTLAFVVNADQAEAAPRAVISMLEVLRFPIDYLGMQIPMEVRLGVAIFPEHGKDANTLIRRAIIAEGSERAAERGLAYYKPSRDSFSADRLTIVSELRQALINNQLSLYLQPKMSLATDNVVGMEALIRWPDKQDSVRPDEIIELAEQTGLIKPLTRWVLEQALIMRSQMLEQGWDLGISINISPNNLREPDFPMFVQKLMSRYQSVQGGITFEVTETSMMQDPANSLRTLRSLNATGIPVSIDDFGSGYSSLSYIKQLPASEVKIDRSLVTDLATQSEDRVIVQTTIDMCHSLGYQVVAEGVENQITATILRSMGCDMIQGFMLTPPLPFDDALDWLDGTDTQQRLQG